MTTKKSYPTIVTAFYVMLFIGCGQPSSERLFNLEGASWSHKNPETTASFRGISVVNHDVIWISGTNGTYLRSLDGGKTWTIDTVPGALYLDFRDVYAIDGRTAYLMSIGTGTSSRIYKTSDGGANWTLQFTMQDSAGFLDEFAFWDENNGIAVGDPVDESIYMIKTSDGGKSWSRVPAQNLPPIRSGEYCFAASGTGIVTVGNRHVWFGTGGVAARVFRSGDMGETWTVANTPIMSGEPSEGIFSLAFRDTLSGVAVGGDYTKPKAVGANAALTRDGGRTWTPINENPPSGFRSAVVFLPGAQNNALLTTGTWGSDFSLDSGLTWTNIDTTGFNALAVSPRGNAVWAAGPRGSVAQLLERSTADAF